MSIINFLKSLFNFKKKEDSNISKEENISNENTNTSDISESFLNCSEDDNKEEEKIYNNEIIKEKEDNVVSFIFSTEEISNIRSILKPIIRSYNYEKRDVFYYYSPNTDIKLMRCFITTLFDSTILLVRPTQSDIYNNSIELFVRECIFRDFKDALLNNNINNLDIETYNGKIIIRKINIKETTNQ